MRRDFRTIVFPGLVLLVLAGARPSSAQESRAVRTEKSDGWRYEIDERGATFYVKAGQPEPDPDRDRESFLIHRSFWDARAKNPACIPSLAEICGLTSELDDRVIEALELLMDRGIPGQMIGRAAFLRALENEVCADGPADACAYLIAAQEIGGAESRPTAHRAAIDAVAARFRASRHAIPSIGIYSSSPALDRIFQQAMFVRSQFDRGDPVARRLREVLERKDGLAHEYRKLNDLAASITSWLTVPHLLQAEASAGPSALFPASRSPEGDFIKAVWYGRPVPEGVAMLREIAEAVRSGRISVAPEPRAGWYDHRIFAIEPLVRPEAAAESRKVIRSRSYAALCEESFLALLTRVREAHAKQVDYPAAGGGGPRPNPAPMARIAPRIRIEPQPTVYRRLADSYAWLRIRLEALGGPALVDGALAAAAPRPFVARTIREALTAAEGAYRDLERISLADVGTDSVPRGDGLPAGLDIHDFDPRVAVPLAYDLDRRKFRCAAIIGVRTALGEVRYDEKPVVRAWNKAGVQVPIEDGQVRWEAQRIAFAVPVVEEVWLTTPLTREALRRLCDENVTHEKIRAALAALG